MQRKMLIPALIMAAGVATANGLVYAQSLGVIEDDALIDLANVRITLVQAVAIAEQHVGGSASQAELESENGRLVYAIEVMGDTKTIDVRIDAADGTVVSTESAKDREESGAGRGVRPW